MTTKTNLQHARYLTTAVSGLIDSGDDDSVMRAQVADYLAQHFGRTVALPVDRRALILALLDIAEDCIRADVGQARGAVFLA